MGGMYCDDDPHKFCTFSKGRSLASHEPPSCHCDIYYSGFIHGIPQSFSRCPLTIAMSAVKRPVIALPGTSLSLTAWFLPPAVRRANGEPCLSLQFVILCWSVFRSSYSRHVRPQQTLPSICLNRFDLVFKGRWPRPCHLYKFIELFSSMSLARIPTSRLIVPHSVGVGTHPIFFRSEAVNIASEIIPRICRWHPTFSKMAV
ncbi:hypothetical protein BKA93DRAFT_251086 [Sparassis latifolia]